MDPHEPAATALATRAQSPPASDAAGYLTLERVSKSFGGQAVVRDLSLSVARGEFVSLLGPSGCGKTTTLRMVAGFMPVDAGEIHLDGQRIDALPTDKRGATMVFQNYALFPHMTVAENVAFGLRMRRTGRDETTRRVHEAVTLVRLAGLEHRYPRQLSGGQQQRVALARAIVLHPRLLLLDEPLSNLDAKLRKELRRDLVDIHRAAGVTTLFVTHDLEEAFSVSDRVAVMSEGRVEQFDTPANVFLRPRTPFVAEFVGHANVFQGAVEERDDAVRFMSVGGTRIVVPADAVPGTTMRFAVPGHAIRVTRGATDADNSHASTVVGRAYLGAVVALEADMAGTRIVLQVPAEADALTLAVGDRIHLSWDNPSCIRLPAPKP